MADVKQVMDRMGLSKQQAEREILQARLLSAIFLRSVRHELVLKGGMALRATQGSLRMTTDIDFSTSPMVRNARIRTIVRDSFRELERSGFLEESKLTNPKDTDTVQRFKIEGRLAGSDHRMNMTVEVSRRGLPAESHLVRTIYRPPEGSGVQPTLVESFDATSILAGKVLALGSPNREKPRDIFDIAMLVELKVEPPIAQLQLLSSAQLDAIRENVTQKVQKLDWDTFCQQVMIHLPRAYANRITPEDWDMMRLVTEESVRQWTEQAKAAQKAATHTAPGEAGRHRRHDPEPGI